VMSKSVLDNFHQSVFRDGASSGEALRSR